MKREMGRVNHAIFSGSPTFEEVISNENERERVAYEWRCRGAPV